jgi:hypothetical protein
MLIEASVAPIFQTASFMPADDRPEISRPHGGLVWFLVPDIRKIEGAGDGRDEAGV